MIKRIFKTPVYEDPEDNFRARFMNGFLWTIIILLTIPLISYLFLPTFDFTIVVLSGLIILMFVSLYVLRKGNTNASGMLIVVFGWLGLGIQAFTADGVKDVIILGYLAVGLLASIVINWQAGSYLILASIGAIWALAFSEVNGFIVPHVQDTIGYSRDLSLVFIVIAVLVYFSTTSLRDAIQRARESEKDLFETNKKLQELNRGLETRVASRTEELEHAYQRNERRAKLFEAIAQIARTTISNQAIEIVLTELVQLIGESFGFYHIGIFLLDENKEFAVLKAANSAGGKRMLERKHKLKLGQVGIVGYVTASGRPRIALDVGDDAAFFDNPDLPDTRSEMALPLRVADNIIGALDIQSTEPNAFQQEDIEILSILADQVSIAIQSAQSHETTQILLKEAQKASGSYLRSSWQALQLEEESLGYLMSDNKLIPLEKPLTASYIQQAIADKETVKENGETATLAVPIRLRGEVIGVIDIHVTEEHEWEQDEVDITEAIAERLSLALESAMLLKSTERRAEIERVTADISGKISASTQFDSILRIAAEELSRVFGGSEVLVQVQPPESSNGSES